MASEGKNFRFAETTGRWALQDEALAVSHASLGRALRNARGASGLRLIDVAKSLGIALSALSDIENGKRRVSAVELYKFAQLYGRPIEFFLRETESSAPFAILLRAVANTEVREQTIIDFHELCHSYGELEELMRTPQLPAPPNYSSSVTMTLEAAEHLAEGERARLGLDGEPIKDVCELLEEKAGVKIFHLPEDSEIFSGAFACDERLGACFLVNSKHPRSRRTFTVAHEYGHCLAHRNLLAHVDLGVSHETKSPTERFANAFAAAFLMPKRAVTEAFLALEPQPKRELSLETLVHLAMYFGVSFQAMGWRLINLRRIDRAGWEDFLDKRAPLSPVARLFGYEETSDEPEMLPRRYRYLAYRAYKTGRISFEKLAELLRRNYYELREEFDAGVEQDVH